MQYQGFFVLYRESEILPTETYFYIAKGIQDKILEELQNAGIKFKFESDMKDTEQAAEENIQSM